MTEYEARFLLDVLTLAKQKALDFERRGIVNDCLSGLRRPENWVDVESVLSLLHSGLTRRDRPITAYQHHFDAAMNLLTCVEEVERAQAMERWLKIGGVVAGGVVLSVLIGSILG
jgi:hypothetical protein